MAVKKLEVADFNLEAALAHYPAAPLKPPTGEPFGIPCTDTRWGTETQWRQIADQQEAWAFSETEIFVAKNRKDGYLGRRMGVDCYIREYGETMP